MLPVTLTLLWWIESELKMYPKDSRSEMRLALYNTVTGLKEFDNAMRHGNYIRALQVFDRYDLSMQRIIRLFRNPRALSARDAFYDQMVMLIDKALQKRKTIKKK